MRLGLQYRNPFEMFPGFALLAATVVGHGSLTIPPSRNNFGQKSPANRTGSAHLNQGPCVGGACLWFSEGCFLGCSECSAVMPTGGNQHDSPNCSDFVPNTPMLPERYRTYNAKNLSASGDWTRYHPWRSPGKAPLSDPCGVAGGYSVATGGGGETPPGAKQGDKGSHLPPTAAAARWKSGATAEVGWMVAANHGGGYSYSLCPKSQPIGEGCFNAHPLAFADAHHTIRYLNGTEFAINATDVDVGTFPAGSTWRLNPIPACACDWGRGCNVAGTNTMQKAYESCDTCDYLECGEHVPTQFPAPFDFGWGQQIWNRKAGTAAGDDWQIVDRIKVPAAAGEYVLRWRWDTEQNPQVWTNCADVTIAAYLEG